MILLLQLHVLTDHDFVGNDEVVLPVVHPVYIVDDVPHPGGASADRGLGVAVGSVYERVVEHVVHFLHEVFLQLAHPVPYPLPQELVVPDALHYLPDDDIGVEHDVPRREQFGLLLLQPLLAERPEAGRHHILDNLCQELLDFGSYILVDLTFPELLLLVLL